MGISFSEASDNGLISKRTLNLIPDKCKCGADIQFSNSFYTLYCINNKCEYKMSGILSNACKSMGINVETDTLIELASILKISTAYQLFMLKDAVESNIIDKNEINGLKELVQNIEIVKQKEYLLYEAVEFCGIQEISSIAYKLFFGFNSIDEAYAEIEAGQIAFVNEHLGIKSPDNTILSVEIFNKLMSIKDQLIFCETQLKIKKHKNIIRIAINDNILPFINKNELLDYMNDRYKKYTFLLITSVSDSTDILVYNGVSTNIKYRAASAINDKYIAKLMNNNILELKDVGKQLDGKLKPLGCKIYIDSLSNILKHLDSIVFGDKHGK